MKAAVLYKCATIVLMALLIFSSGLTVTCGVWALANTWHVSTTGSDTAGDGSEARPFAAIQHGIDMATNGDTVLVHPGVYRENINFNGKNITVGSLFMTTGAADYILQTVIDGNRNGHVVMFVNGETVAAKLSGFTITNGYAHSSPDSESERGGGIRCSSSHPTLTDLKVTGNEAIGEGGGLYFAHCSPTIRNVAITNNQAGTGGGGIRYSYGSVNLENVVVSHNSAYTGGSGIFLYHADGIIKNVLIADNTGGGKGGGLVFDGSSPTLVNVTIVGNRTTDRGGAMNISYASQPTLVSSIVWGNTPEQIYFDTDWPGEAVTVEYSDIQGGEAGIITNGQGPVHWSSGNLDTSPRFVHAGLGNYRLADNSPAIGAGKADGASSTDLEGNPRPNPAGSHPDMGAYESPHSSAVLRAVYLPLISRALPPPPQRPFWAERYRLDPGECTTLHWSVTNVQAVYLNDEGVPEQGGRVVCPVATTVYVLRVVRTSGTQEYRLTIVVDDDNSWVGVDADGNFYRGNPDATVKLEEFMDFQCPYSARHALQTGPLLDEAYIATGEVLQVFRNFPLNGLHSNAVRAAKAAYCAGQQSPELFWTMYHWLFENQGDWNSSSDPSAQFRSSAVIAGADGPRLDACIANLATEAHIQHDVQEGVARGLRAVPTFFINEWVIVGAVPFAEFQDKIEKAKRGLVPTPTPTPALRDVESLDAHPARPGVTYEGSPVRVP